MRRKSNPRKPKLSPRLRSTIRLFSSLTSTPRAANSSRRRHSTAGSSQSGRGGLHLLLGMSLSPCCRFHPAEVEMPHRPDFGTPCCLRPSEAGSALGSRLFEATYAFTVVTARRLVASPREALSMGFRISEILDTPAILPSELQGS